MPTCGEDSQTLICGVCRDVYKDPKFLHCHHTFCAKCIEGLANHHQGHTFHCPVCRTEITLLPGEVASLQTNFYIPENKLEEARRGRVCLKHGKKFRSFCSQCAKKVCKKCILTEHQEHLIVELDAKSELRERQSSLAQSVNAMKELKDSVERDIRHSIEKKIAVEKNIHDRHALIVAAAESLKREALQSLESAQSSIENELELVGTQQEDNIREALTLHSRIESTLNDGTNEEIMTLAKDLLRDGDDRQHIGNAPKFQTVLRPVLQFSVAADAMTQTLRNFLGGVSVMTMDLSTTDCMSVTEKFTCGTAKDIEVYSMCHLDGDEPCVLVYYERYDMKNDAPGMTFSETGRVLHLSQILGKTCARRYSTGKYINPVPQTGTTRSTLSKSLTETYFQLDVGYPGKGEVSCWKVDSTDPLIRSVTERFGINVGVHRTFDADDTGRFFAVVEETRHQERYRKVLLYRRSVADPIDTYCPPVPSFQPSDVCFYRHNRQQYLLVTDELNDAVHMVQIETGKMKFVRYLVPGCSAIIQPTAITCDVYRRLWVACRGGKILTIEPA